MITRVFQNIPVIEEAGRLAGKSEGSRDREELGDPQAGLPERRGDRTVRRLVGYLLPDSPDQIGASGLGIAPIAVGT